MDTTIVILNEINNVEDYEQLIKLNFEKVYVEKDSIKAVKKCNEIKSSILLLVDLDNIKFNTKMKKQDYIIYFLKNIIRDLANYTPVIVCSKLDSSNLMMNCIQIGVVDYLIKPIYANVIKTLFLKSYQNNTNNNGLLLLPPSPNSLYDKMNDMNVKNLNLSKVLMNTFLPISTSTQDIAMITKKRLSEIELKISSWDFNPFEFTQQELIQCVYTIFNKLLSLKELKSLNIKKAQLINFIIDLSNVYHNENPYHNFFHAVDVLQCLYYIFCQLGLLPFTKNNKFQNLLAPADIFALFIAAIGHDAAHPGVNNVFLINSMNPLATLYNDQSVLESLHSMTLFQLLHKHGISQLIGDQKSKEYKDFRKMVVSSILATDMAFHMDYVEKIKNLKLNSNLNDSEKVLLCNAFIKCADISNVARPFHRGLKWAELINKEFIEQGDLEKELGLPVLPMNDRATFSLEDSQINFIQYIALDLFQIVNQLFHHHLSFAFNQIKSNLNQWEKRKLQPLEQPSVVFDANQIDPILITNEHIVMIETGSKRSSTDSLDYSSDIKKLKKTHSLN